MTAVPADDAAAPAAPSAVPAGRPRFGWPTMTLFGLGSIANSVKARGIATFLNLYYAQVLGLSPGLVGLGLSVALLLDAFIDPTVGQISDNVRTRWGRRHPFMYAAALPVAIAFFLIWNPPTGWEGMQLFAYMMACLLTIRLFDTFFELPSSALVPELAVDYHERTTLIGIRTFFGIVGGLGMTIAAYQIFMRENPDGSGGVLARDGYLNYSITCAILIFTTILISTAATHRFIPWLRKAPVRKITASGQAREILATLKNHAFFVATLSGMFTAVASSTKAFLDLYFNLYFWGFSQGQLSLLALAAAGAGALGAAAAPALGRMQGKKWAAITAYSLALAVGVTPLLGRLLGVLWENGDPRLFTFIFVEVMINSFFALATTVLLSSMIADIVEDAEVKTGRRSEGLLFSADNLFKKITSAGGPAIGGLILSIVAFPRGVDRHEVPRETLYNLALVYLPTAATLFGIAIVCLLLFRLDKTTHDENLRKLAEAQALLDAEESARPSTSGSV